MARPKTKREKILSVRVAPIIDARLQKLSEIGGQSPALLASLALTMGLRMLEEDIYGTMPIDEIIKMGTPLSELVEKPGEDFEVLDDGQQPVEVQSSKRPPRDKFKMEQPRSDWAGYMANL